MASPFFPLPSRPRPHLTCQTLRGGLENECLLRGELDSHALEGARVVHVFFAQHAVIMVLTVHSSDLGSLIEAVRVQIHRMSVSTV